MGNHPLSQNGMLLVAIGMTAYLNSSWTINTTTTTTQSSCAYFITTEMLISKNKTSENFKRSRKSRAISNTKVRGLTYPDFKAYHEVTVSSAVWYQHTAEDVNVVKN